jgi:Fe-S oxidoreductase
MYEQILPTMRRATRASIKKASMRIGLFIPCYMGAFEPEVGIATLELLEKLGCTVDYPFDRTCCGQPMTNTGCHKEAAGAEALFAKNFSGFDYIVARSGSCAHRVRVNMTAIEQTPEVRAVRERTLELTARPNPSALRSNARRCIAANASAAAHA